MNTDEIVESFQNPASWVLFSLFMVWTFLWKGLALYRAGANRSPGWFVVLLLVNTLGILEILYLLIFSRRRKREVDARLGVL